MKSSDQLVLASRKYGSISEFSPPGPEESFDAFPERWHPLRNREEWKVVLPLFTKSLLLLFL